MTLTNSFLKWDKERRKRHIMKSGQEPEGRINPSNLAFTEELFQDYLTNPASVSEEWRRYFSSLTENHTGGHFETPHWDSQSIFHGNRNQGVGRPLSQGEGIAELQDRVDQLLRAYRIRGHEAASIDPLGQKPPRPPELNPETYGFTEVQMGQKFSYEFSENGPSMPLASIVDKLQNTYCRSIGVEYMHISDKAVRRWLQERMETSENRLTIQRDQQLRILTRLTDAVVFEEFIHKKFIGAKSFSLEGSESLIPLLDMAIEKAGSLGISEVVMGMAHRGRLNVLANIMGKSPSQIFREFTDADPEKYEGRGDVKYHLGFSNDWVTAAGKKVHLSLCFNPSHLEFVNPVLLGRVRAKQDRKQDTDHSNTLGLLIHGDSAFIGEGVVQEGLNLSCLSGYRTGGTLHIILNNQIGFTTMADEGRSTQYATDVAKMLQIPIFHVNGEDPEAVAQVINLAMDFRREFQMDLVIDMYGYRRLGHNESDEPAFTQPVLYRKIRQRKTVREGYLDHLLKQSDITRDEADKIQSSRSKLLEEELNRARSQDYHLPATKRGPVWSTYFGGPERDATEPLTGVDRDKLVPIARKLTTVPDGFQPHPKLSRLLESRWNAVETDSGVDWAWAEALAFGSLAMEGYTIRLSGQDSCRGTFSHRHARLHDYKTGETHMPLQHMSPDQAAVEIYNSPLSEIAVLGFDYGYSLDTPDGLILWEAQFGDFANVAQVIIDQFISSAEDKWHLLSGLVMLLPHGFEGQGPEHSSARLERFLALCAEDNIQVCQPSNPQQYFHLLRRQMVRKWRKPLVVMTPKSLLRHPKAQCSLSDLTEDRFHRVLGEVEPIDASKVKRILLCSGRVYYDLVSRRSELGRQDIAIVRVEQFYPFCDVSLSRALEPYDKKTPITWVQDEPENMGAWWFMRVHFGDRLLGTHELNLVSRPPSASPATGSSNSHKREQEKLLTQAFDDSYRKS